MFRLGRTHSIYFWMAARGGKQKYFSADSEVWGILSGFDDLFTEPRKVKFKKSVNGAIPRTLHSWLFYYGDDLLSYSESSLNGLTVHEPRQLAMKTMAINAKHNSLDVFIFFSFEGENISRRERVHHLSGLQWLRLERDANKWRVDLFDHKLMLTFIDILQMQHRATENEGARRMSEDVEALLARRFIGNDLKALVLVYARQIIIII